MERDLKSPAARLKCPACESFVYAASLHNNRDGIDFALNLVGNTTQWPPDRPIIDNPCDSGYLNEFLYKVQAEQDPTLPIPHQILEGFSDCGDGYYNLLQKLAKTKPELIFTLLKAKNPRAYFHDLPGKKEQRAELLDFLTSLREAMAALAADPIGERRIETTTEVAQKIMHLPNREALVSTGETVYHMRTHETYPPISDSERRQKLIDNSVEYLRSKDDVERFIQTRLTYFRAQVVDTEYTSGSIEVTEPERTQAPTPDIQVPVQQDLAVQISKSTTSMESLDTLNMLCMQMRAKVIDPDTAILAALGEHYVMTIKQWMRLFEWGSYPRATQYFKELREEGLIYRKDREGRGGQLVEGDWFFLLTKGANELMKRKQPSPLFRMEPNEAEKASGDTLFHTYLVNDLLIHLRLLEREQPETLRIEQIDHERSMRRTYLSALADSKLYPDGFLRLLIPTPNGLKRRYAFLELQHTTQRDEANWKAKCKKYLALFEQEAVLEKFFATKTPQVLVITIDPAYVNHHKTWTEEVLAEAGGRRQGYNNRFLIGAYEPGIRDNALSPAQFFCTPRFSIPFQDSPHAFLLPKN
jgi:Replication-relaxation